MDLLVPDMYQKSIYHINYDKLKDNGIKCLLFDLDNTLIPYKDKMPSKKLIKLIEEIKDKGFKVIIFSNAKKERIKPIKTTLIVDASAFSLKPLKRNFNKIIKKYNYSLSEVAIIGDQLFTDILGGNRVGIKTILVNPMSVFDSKITYLQRVMEKRVIKKWHKKGILTKEEYYE